MSPAGPGRRAADTAWARGPGALAIDRRVDRIDGCPELHRYRPRAPNRFKGAGPLRAVTAHRLVSPDHWHLVTYGLSELEAKESDDPGVSGWGCELTMRVAAVADTTAATGRLRPRSRPGGIDEPAWAVDLLTNLAAYVWTSGHGFSAGHHLDLRGPIRLDKGTELTAAVLVVDPRLGGMKGPFGRVAFLQVVALSADELELCRSWSTEGVVDVLRARDPLLVTRLDRPSLLSDPAVAQSLRTRAALEGGAVSELQVATLKWGRRGRSTLVQMGAGASAALGPALRRELVTETSSFKVIGDTGEVRFIVAAQAAWQIGAGRLDVSVPLGEVDDLAGLFDGRPGWGRKPSWPGLRWRVVP